MSASASDVFAVLGRIHVLLRRDLNRITDIEWASTDRAYAQEVVRLCGTASHPDLKMLSAKLVEMLELGTGAPVSTARMPQPMGPTTQAAVAEVTSSVSPAAAGPRYLGGLR
jgi:hypothetical protein